MKVDGPLEDVTFKIIGAAMVVHNAMGPGLKESAYHHALSLELQRSGLGFVEEMPVQIQLDGTIIGRLYLDHLVEGSVVVEIKALSHMLTAEEFAQVITYLVATGHPVGLLVNFGRKRLEYRRILPPKDSQAWTQRIRRYVWNPRRA
jgi:GxxExxY protein